MTGIRNAFLSAVLLIIGWQALSVLSGLPRFILPSATEVLASMWHNRTLIAEHAVITLAEVILGMVIGSVLGALTAIGLAVSTSARNLLRPVLVFSQAVPVFALAPLLTLWLGYGLPSKIAMAVLIIYFPVTSSFFDGLMQTPKGYLDLAQTMGSSSRRTLYMVRVPAALPALASGLRLAAVYAPIGAVIGEWVGASKGLGYLMLLANGRAKIDLMFAAMIVLGIMAVTLYLGVDWLARRTKRGH